jgi:uncharacterized protein (DUF2164 family)
MSIDLSRDDERRLIASIKRYFAESLEQEIGDLKASLLLKYVLKEIAPTIYNRAVGDAQARMQEMVSEVDGTCHEPEFGYWTKT